MRSPTIDKPTPGQPARSTPWRRSWEGWQGEGERPGRTRPPLLRLLLRWPLLVVLVFAAAIGAATDLTKATSNAERVSDLRSFYAGEQVGISSCSGGLQDSLYAYRQVVSGRPAERTLAASIAISGAEACSPTSNGDLFDMASSVPPRSVISAGLGKENELLYAWAFPTASRVQEELSVVLEDHLGPGSRLYANVVSDLTTLQRQGRQIQQAFDVEAQRLGTTLAPLTPSITAASPSSL